jgi:hypothetical protein
MLSLTAGFHDASSHAMMPGIAHVASVSEIDSNVQQ